MLIWCQPVICDCGEYFDDVFSSFVVITWIPKSRRNQSFRTIDVVLNSLILHIGISNVFYCFNGHLCVILHRTKRTPLWPNVSCLSGCKQASSRDKIQQNGKIHLEVAKCQNSFIYQKHKCNQHKSIQTHFWLTLSKQCVPMALYIYHIADITYTGTVREKDPPRHMVGIQRC